MCVLIYYFSGPRKFIFLKKIAGQYPGRRFTVSRAEYDIDLIQETETYT